ncbi:MAG: proline--tRNA ligase [Clostridia bacterium]|nr:proline--tRNA ligase [Clostridia bacterium]
MLQSKLIGDTKKEWPNEATLKSHGLLLKGGYIKQMASGIFTLMPLGKKVSAKIENIIREEMNAIDAQEVQMPVVATKKLWDSAKRYDAIGSELLRFKDRTGADMVLSMTHEEAAVFSVLNEASSYTKYPFSIYQIQTKFRDEARSRGGLIRVREFTMKDAYSFHTSEASLNEVYDKYYEAYNKIFARVGIPEVVPVASDTGMMGGSGAHEYMLLCDAGEDKIVACKNCDYSANMDVAVCKSQEPITTEIKDLSEVHTPDVKTIEDLQNFLELPNTHFAKAVVYYRIDTDETVVVFIRGDKEVNETKLRNILKVDDEYLVPKAEEDDGICYGFIGPMGLNAKVKLVTIFDKSLENEACLVAGANKQDYHMTGVNIKRDVGNVDFVDVAKVKDTDSCIKCGKQTLRVSNGIEVGNIFKLGTKYTSAMNMTYLDENGKSQTPIMGCYGIGVGRLMASVLEARATERQTNWPHSIAPFDVHICPLDYTKNDEVKAKADELYNVLTSKGYDVLLDDRAKSAGVKFADADLIGASIRIVVSGRNLEAGKYEVKVTGDAEATLVDMDKIYEYIENEMKGWEV